MARIRPSWTPPNTDNSNNEHNLGYDFQADIAITANGLWWWQDGLTPPSTVRAMLWLTSGPTLVADSGTVSTTGYSLSAWNFIPFASAFACAANTSYSVSVYSTGTYRYSSSDLATDQVDGSGHVRALAHTGRFANAAGPVFPSSTWDGMFGVDLDFTAGSSTVNGTATLTGAGSLAALATQRATATLTGAGALSAAVRQGSSATLSGAGTVSAVVTQGSKATLAGVGALTSSASALGAVVKATSTAAVTALRTSSAAVSAPATSSAAVSARATSTGGVT